MVSLQEGGTLRAFGTIGQRSLVPGYPGCGKPGAFMNIS